MKNRLLILTISLGMLLSLTLVPVNAKTEFTTAAVKNVKATSMMDESAKVSCSRKSGASGYQYYLASSKNGRYAKIAQKKTNSIMIGNLSVGKTYYFKIRAYQKKNGKTTYSRMSSAVRFNLKPVIKLNVSSCYEVDVSWGVIKKISAVKVYRSLSKYEGFKCIKTAGKSETTFYDNSLKKSTTYYYKVKVTVGSGNMWSDVKSIKTHPTARYDIDKDVTFVGDSNITGKTVYFLGSSITYGSASHGIAFADYVAKRNCLNYTPEMKEAVSGTTMAVLEENHGSSYAERIVNLAMLETSPDVFMCQLSLNDAIKDVPIGEIKGPDAINDEDNYYGYDITTSIGAMEFIVAFAQQNWPDCQIAFYTIKNNGGEKYEALVNMLKGVQNAWGMNEYGKNTVEILDIWNTSSFMANISNKRMPYYMKDAYHPYKVGYYECWTPVVEEFLKGIMPEVEE